MTYFHDFFNKISFFPLYFFMFELFTLIYQQPVYSVDKYLKNG